MNETVRAGCRLCGESAAMQSLQAREMMFGTREWFDYERCGACGSLQIRDVPGDLARHYPAGYYAHGGGDAGGGGLAARAKRGVKHRLRTEWMRALLHLPRPLFGVLLRVPGVGPRTAMHALTPLRGHLRRESRVVDVGGGDGLLLRTLRDLGLRHLTCADPFVEQRVEDGIRFRRASLADVGEEFDVVMYHHSMEHVPDVVAELRAIARSLAPNGVALLRLPLLPNAAFDEYGADWVQLDAPRHLHVPSRRGLAAAAARAGLRVLAQGDDSTAFQFWGSELYRRDIPLREGEPRLVELFRAEGLAEFARKARAANASGRGDQGWLLLARDTNG